MSILFAIPIAVLLWCLLAYVFRWGWGDAIVWTILGAIAAAEAWQWLWG